MKQVKQFGKTFPTSKWIKTGALEHDLEVCKKTPRGFSNVTVISGTPCSAKRSVIGPSLGPITDRGRCVGRVHGVVYNASAVTRGACHMLSEKSQRTQNGTMFVDLDWPLNASSSSSSKVQSSMVEYHALVVYGHVTWLSGRSNNWCLLWRRRVSQTGSPCW